MSGGGAARFRRWYGESPWQLALLAASFALTGYAGVRLLDGDAVGVLVWFVGAALLHDLVLLPLYSLADRLPRLAGRPWTNHLRVPAALSLLLLLVWFPLIAGPPERYERVTGLPGGGGFARRWLLVSAALFALSGLLFLARRTRKAWTACTVWKARRQARRQERREERRKEREARAQEARRRSATNERPPDAH